MFRRRFYNFDVDILVFLSEGLANYMYLIYSMYYVLSRCLLVFLSVLIPFEFIVFCQNSLFQFNVVT